MAISLVDVGGHRLSLSVEGSGGPAVVIITALGGFAAEWRGIQSRLASETTVICYDRAGYGQSDPGPFPRTSTRAALELRSLLDRTGIPGPYVVVGHSQGGLYANHFARLFPGDVAGVVLIDAVSLDDARFAAEIPKYGKMVSVVGITQKHKLNRLLAKSGLLRMAKPWVRNMVKSNYAGLPAECREEILNEFMKPRYWDALVDELAHTYESFSAVKGAGPFPDVPLIVLYHTPSRSIEYSMQFGIPEEQAKAIESLWEELNRQFLALSPRSEWRMAEHSGHMLHMDEPDTVVEAVRSICRPVLTSGVTP